MGLAVYNSDAAEVYDRWPEPVTIIADGPYGVDGYDGDLKTATGLAQWYEPHVKKWAERSTPLTTLWFWNTEVGWAEVHPVLRANGWIYRCCCVWDKGIAHVAGNCNTQTLRMFPVVTEVCVHYVRQTQFKCQGRGLSAQDWLRSEWSRTGLPWSEANAACGVANAATRKYLTSDHMWYFPPSGVFEKLVQYANEQGKPEGRPYFSLDGVNVLQGSQWEKLRSKFRCEAGVTNVWHEPAVRGNERIKTNGKAIHPNQKPRSLMKRIIEASSDRGDVVWEPFGGLCTGAIVAAEMGRDAHAAEINPETFRLALSRAKREMRDLEGLPCVTSFTPKTGESCDSC
jgi:hypothetical protein